MNRTFTITLGLFAGLAGGLLSRYIAPQTAFAQDKAPAAQDVSAHTFTLVDPNGKPAGVFSVEGGSKGISSYGQFSQERIVLRDARGSVIWSAGGNGIHPASER